MTDLIRFTKMHGAGNDYIYVNSMVYPLEKPAEVAVEWSKLHTGIGADGLVLIGDSGVADFSMRIFNADGSEALMCGNASRCIGKFVFEKGLTDKKRITLETLSGVKILDLNTDGDFVKDVTVDMGRPSVGDTVLSLEAGGRVFCGTVISMGNPHFVIFTDDLDGIDIDFYGPLLECNSFFPDRTNVEFAQVISPGEIRMRVWERGSGVTMACGTGACATAVAGVISGKTGRKTKVIMDGGVLGIHWEAVSGRVSMTGEAVTVFEGEISTSGRNLAEGAKGEEYIHKTII